MGRLSWKLGGALLLVALIAVGIMAVLVNQNVSTEFRNYIQHGNMMYIQNLSSDLSRYYNLQKDWTGIQDVLEGSLRSNRDRLVLADSSGRIIADTAGEWQGELSADLNLNNGVSVKSSGQTIGTLYGLTSGGAAGHGQLTGRGMMGSGSVINNEQTGTFPSAETNFLNRTNNYLWIAGSIAIVAALLLGILLARQITHPLRALANGAHEIAKGNLGYRVKLNSKDELGELGQSFNSMAISLDRSEQARKRLISDVTHELRTPLTIIEGTVDGMLDGVFPADKEYLDSIKEQTALLTHLVSSLRDISLAESGHLKLERVFTNPADLVSRKLSQFEPAAREKEVLLKMEAAADIPEVKVDVRRMDQVIANLLSNALRHSAGGGIITVTLHAADHISHLDKPGLMLSVHDTGEGIPAEHLPHLFERFYRVEDSRSKNEGGVGLGLSIVKQMVQAHGGQVWAESEPGKGSTFHVALPLDETK